MDNATKIKNGYNKRFPTLLRELMETTGATQEDLAEAVGVTRQSIGKYMNGEAVVDIEKFLKIVSFFKDKKGIDYSTDYWLGNSNTQGQNDKDIIHYSDKCIQNLKRYQKDGCTRYSIEQLINNEKFIQAFENYVINNNMQEVFYKNEILKDYYAFNVYNINYCADYEVHDLSKYAFAEFLEIIPLMKEAVYKDLTKNKYMIFEIMAKLRKDYLEEYNRQKKFREEEPLNMDSYIKILKSASKDSKYIEECKKLLKEYNNYILKTKGDTNLLFK